MIKVATVIEISGAVNAPIVLFLSYVFHIFFCEKPRCAAFPCSPISADRCSPVWIVFDPKSSPLDQ